MMLIGKNFFFKLIMFIVTFLIVITQTSIIASAISLDLFSTTTHQNNSGTSLEAPFLNVVDIHVTKNMFYWKFQKKWWRK